MTKKQLKNLFDYLDGFCFVLGCEVVGAVEDFIREEIEKDEKRTPSY